MDPLLALLSTISINLTLSLVSLYLLYKVIMGENILDLLNHGDPVVLKVKPEPRLDFRNTLANMDQIHNHCPMAEVWPDVDCFGSVACIDMQPCGDDDDLIPVYACESHTNHWAMDRAELLEVS